ncbi:hypothetical protein LTR37_006528 [Vermiconidia calcicola]|uniref:Uncharacterized protein n=1 Tax=Vermiconidia calcicola TaxID=1690605 RepID=A0ACC3NJ32_9PEZI|nr:hypothetical protein LTR37_006528 [Vermiconidia calcicola]
MSAQWKSTPTHWCKFCALYVRDTPLERKNHDASGKHQNNIQRSLRELHRGKEREEREKQRAKDEVARVNGLVSGSGGKSGGRIQGVTSMNGGGGGAGLSKEAQRKAHAEQLLALGVKLPEQLEREVTGAGGWQTVSERVVEDAVKQEEDSKEGIIHGVHKRKVEEDEEGQEAERKARRKAWGSSIKTFPGAEDGEEDLEALLSGVRAKEVKKEEDEVKKEESAEDGDALAAVPDIDAAIVKKEDGNGDGEVMAPVVFKKRKAKR